MKLNEMYNRGANDYKGYVVDEIVDEIVDQFTMNDQNTLPDRSEILAAAKEQLSKLYVEIVDDAQRKIEDRIYDRGRM